jgi:hypothetical protein
MPTLLLNDDLAVRASWEPLVLEPAVLKAALGLKAEK